jgi:hypothetical protein
VARNNLVSVVYTVKPLHWSLVIFAVLAVGVVAAQMHLWRQRTAWRELAQRMNLRFEQGHIFHPARVFGAYRGRALLLDTTMRRGYRRWIHYTRIRLSINNPAGSWLQLREEGTPERLAKFLGGREAKSDDWGLSERFITKSQPARLAQVIVASSDLSRKLMQLERIQLLKVEGGEVCFEQRGVSYDTKFLFGLIDLLSELAEVTEAEMLRGQSGLLHQNCAVVSAEEFASQRAPTQAKSLLWLLVVLVVGFISMSPYLCILALDLWLR